MARLSLYCLVKEEGFDDEIDCDADYLKEHV